MTSTAAKRTKSGCWTCRLRRKKCNEGGPPCDNCEARGIHCHGYGPKPQWKDRGALEREEARKLQYQSGRARSYSRSSITPAAVVAPKPAEGDSVAGARSSSSSISSNSSLYMGGDGLNGGHEEQHGVDSTAPFPAGAGEFDYLANSAGGMSPLISDINLVLDAHAMNPGDFDFASTPSDSAVDRASSASASASTDSAGFIEWSQFQIFSPELPVATPVALLPPVPVPPIPPGRPAREAAPAAACADLVMGQELLLAQVGQAIGQGHGLGIAEGDPEKGIELMMQYMDDVCSGRTLKGRRISEMGWLLLLLLRSSTFYYTTLSLTSYKQYLIQPAHSASRANLFRDYQEYRSRALKCFTQMPSSTASSLFGGQGSKCSHSALCERLICSVQLAHLEAASGNIQDCQNHIDDAARLLLEQETALVGETHHLSNMERKALAFFTVRLIWNDVLLSSTRRTIPKAEKVYRRLLLADPNNNNNNNNNNNRGNDNTSAVTTTTPLLDASSFGDLTGCEGTVLLAMLDASNLSAWRLREEASGSLSIRALVGRADKIEAVVEGEIARLSSLLPPPPLPDSSSFSSSSSSSSSSGGPAKRHNTGSENDDTVVIIHSLIFAHAILTDLHQTVSGPLANVPEIGDSISRAISSAWNLRQQQQQQHGGGAGLERILAWPYCVAASLAKGDQRDVFREIIARSEAGDGSATLGGDVQQLKSIIEQCWASSSSNCRDWKDVVQRSNQCGVFLI